MAERRERHEPHSIERATALLLRIGGVECEVAMDDLIEHPKIEAARPPQTEHVPIAKEFDLGARRHGDQHDRLTVSQNRNTIFVEDVTAHDPGSIWGPASEAEGAGDAIAIADPLGFTMRRRLTRAGCPLPRKEDLLNCTIPEKSPGNGRTCHGRLAIPAGGSIKVGECAKCIDHLAWMRFHAAHDTGRNYLEKLHAFEGIDHVTGELRCLLVGVRALFDQLAEGA